MSTCHCQFLVINKTAGDPSDIMAETLKTSFKRFMSAVFFGEQRVDQIVGQYLQRSYLLQRKG